jgi:2-phosphosulfolactate phosphatase
LFAINFDWGLSGLAAVGRPADVVVVVDVLRFTTAVDVGVARGAVIIPAPFHAQKAAQLALDHDAEVAGVGSASGFSLSPVSLDAVEDGRRLVLPSPNGATVALAARGLDATVIAGSLRNASAVAQKAQSLGATISVIASGERWPDGSLRPCLEDLLGAGAVLCELELADQSPEARMAVAAYQASQIVDDVARCPSGVELIEKGYGLDLAMATAVNASQAVPTLDRDGCFRNEGPTVSLIP